MSDVLHLTGTIVVDDFLQPSDGDITDINPTLGVAPRPGTLAAASIVSSE